MTAIDTSTFPDVETAILYGLSAKVGDFWATASPSSPSLDPPEDGRSRHVGGKTPGDLQARLPFWRVHVFTGDDDLITDHPVADIDVFAQTWEVGRHLAELTRTWMLAAPHVIASVENGTPRTVILDAVSTRVRPFWLPWEDTDVDRFMSTYVISARR